MGEMESELRERELSKWETWRSVQEYWGGHELGDPLQEN